MIKAWRITKTKHAATAFTGGGAKTYGGRWNSAGTAVVYAAGSTSLAILEMLVHLQAQELMRRYAIFEVSFDEALMTSVDPATLPKSWRRFPSPASVQQLGDDWVAEAASAVLRLPSVIVPSEWNYLLNPAHPDFAKITIGPKQQIKFDPRLVKASSS
jgi:RES domain-containing protein